MVLLYKWHQGPSRPLNSCASRGLEATEESLYLGAEQLLHHLTSPWGLNVSESQTVLFGQSIGCAVAIEMASRGFGQRLVLLAPFESILEMAGAAFPLFKPGLRLCPWLVRDRFDNVAKARRLALPALVLHGSRDEVVPQRQGRKVRRLCPNAQHWSRQHVTSTRDSVTPMLDVGRRG